MLRARLLALRRAARDPDDEVRNNATRALGVLVRSNRALAASIPPDTFIEMLNSGTWSDRNKAGMLLMERRLHEIQISSLRYVRWRWIL